MTDTDAWSDFEEKIPRDRWRRPLIVPLGGGKPKAYTRVTTFAGTVEDMYGLGQWQQRMVALGLAKRPDLLLSVSAHAEDKDELNRIADAAKEAAAASAAATTGTALHKLAERYDRGQMSLDDVPESHRADIAAYVAAMAPLTIHGIEEFVVLDDIDVAGTFDRVVEHDGQRYVADIKTGSIEYGAGKMAIQLALYARGDLYDPTGGGRTATGVSTTAGIIIHLPAGTGTCRLHWIDLKAGWSAVELCDKVRTWRKRKGLLAAASFGTVVLEPPALSAAVTESLLSAADDLNDAELEEVMPQLAEVIAAQPPIDTIQAIKNLIGAFSATELPLSDQIEAASSKEELEALWSEHREEWGAEHTRMASARKLQLHQKVLRDAVQV